MLIVKDDPNPDRVVWIDFNRANTYDERHMTDKRKVLIAEEEESMEGFKMYMVRPLKSSHQSLACNSLTFSPFFHVLG